MNMQQVKSANSEYGVNRQFNTCLYGSYLISARIAWLVMAALATGLFIISLPPYYAQLHVICTNLSICTIDGVLTSGGVKLLQTLHLSIESYVIYTLIFTILVELVWSAIGVLIFWRKSDDWMALFVSLLLVTFNPGLLGGPTTLLAHAFPVLDVLVKLVALYSNVAIGLFFFLFPNGQFVPRWTRWFAAVYIAAQLPDIFLPSSSAFHSNHWPVWLVVVVYVSTLGAALLAQVHRYTRVSNVVQRQQTKWVVFGISVVIAGYLLLSLPAAFSPLVMPDLLNMLSDSLWFLVLLPIPLSIGLATLRYRLYDIDILINRTLVYGTLTTLLILVYLGSVFGLQSLLHPFTQNSDLAIVGSTLAIAALFQPLRKSIQKVIDRRFYRSKYDADRTLADFSTTLRSEVDLNQLREHLINVVDETMQPTHVSLWLRQPITKQQQTKGMQL